MNAADGRPMASMGKGQFHLLVDNIYFEHDLYVANLDVDGLLGTDFLSKYNCKIGIWVGKLSHSMSKVKPGQGANFNPRKGIYRNAM